MNNDRSPTRSQQPKDLGKVVAVFKQRFPTSWWALLLLSIAGAISVWYWANTRAVTEAYTHGTIPAGRILEWGLVGILVFAVIAILSLVGLLAYPRFQLVIYEHGLAYLKGKNSVYARWDEIIGIQLDFQRVWWLIFPIKRQNLTLLFFNGTSLMLNHDLQKMEQVKTILEGIVTPILIDEMHSGYDQGAVLPFGPILLSKVNGMKYQNKVMRWETIHTMSVENGWLGIKYYAPGGTLEELSCPVKEIINLPVMLTLIRERLKEDAD